jgi:serine/threonine protein kinase
MTRPEGSIVEPSPVRMTDQMDTVRQGDVRMINQYRIGGQVGKGQHGEVWLCEDTRDDNRQVVRRVSPTLHLVALRGSLLQI